MKCRAFQQGQCKRYFQNIIRRLNHISRLRLLKKYLTKLRDKRDIAKPSKSDLNEFVEIIARLKSYYEEILEIKPSLVEYERKKRWEKRKSRLWQILIPIIATVIGILIGMFLSVS
jgi:hypothetical protein